MEEWQEELEDMRKKLEQAARIDKKVRKMDIIGKTISIKNELAAIKRKLKSKDRTVGDLKKHMKLMAGMDCLFSMYNINSPLLLLHRETQLLFDVYEGLIKTSKEIINELQEESGIDFSSTEG